MTPLTDQQEVWMALSDLFIDNEISYEYIARRIKHLEVDELERILFYEVAPICIHNMLVPIPTVWLGFSEDYIIPEVRRHLQKLHSNWFYRSGVHCKVKFYKWYLGKEWLKVVKEIQQKQANG